MSSGRRPKPTAIKILEGNPGKRPLNQNEPKPELRAPSCPPNLGKEAKKEWRRVVPELLRLGLLTNIDRGTLAAYCEAWGRYVESSRQLAASTLVIQNTHGNLRANPLIAIVSDSEKAVARYASEFGLTPASRSRVSANPPGDEDELPGYDKPKAVSPAADGSPASAQFAQPLKIAQ